MIETDGNIEEVSPKLFTIILHSFKILFHRLRKRCKSASKHSRLHSIHFLKNHIFLINSLENFKPNGSYQNIF